jgi:MoaA/NifB/PqqE/SkfB family radical SAM enzyme
MGIANFLPRFHPLLDWVQVGISTHCDASCAYCPHTRFRSSWKSAHIDPELFSRFLDNLKNTSMVYLQGWGEPFLHPDFWQLLDRVKAGRFMAGCTSNANNLDEETLKKTVDHGLDILALSLAGPDERNDKIRQGTSFYRVFKAIEKLQDIKARQKSETPKIHLAHMLLRSHLGDMDKLPALFMNSGVDHVVISSLTLALSQHWEKQALLADSPEGYRELKTKFDQLFSVPELNGKVFTHVYNPFLPRGDCSENVQKALYVSELGLVSPCVMTQIPVSGPAHYWFEGQRYALRNLNFGSLYEQDMKDIWHKPEYKRFRKRLDLAMCRRCAKTKIEG